MSGKRVTFDPEDWVSLDQLARERGLSFQELADEAFRDVLKKHDRVPPSIAARPGRSEPAVGAAEEQKGCEWSKMIPTSR